MSTQRLSRSGFTLIELLVVISIIALLIAILLPALSKSRAAARAIQCGSQQKQLHLSVEVYRNDYDGFYVPTSWKPTTVLTYHWPTLLREYVNDHATTQYVEKDGLFYCPEVAYTERLPKATYVSYGYNAYGIGGRPTTFVSGFTKALKILPSPPAATLMMLDNRRISDTGYYYSYPSAFFIYERHDDASNAVFADGHVQRMTRDLLEVDVTPATDKAPWFGTNTN